MVAIFTITCVINLLSLRFCDVTHLNSSYITRLVGKNHYAVED